MGTYDSHKFHGIIDMQKDVYYKLFRRKKNNLVTIVCLQWFDEYDYDQESFIKNSDNEIHVFETEEMAIKKLKSWFDDSEIDYEYRHANSQNNIRD